jgi:hypothetical protein
MIKIWKFDCQVSKDSATRDIHGWSYCFIQDTSSKKFSLLKITHEPDELIYVQLIPPDSNT